MKKLLLCLMLFLFVASGTVNTYAVDEYNTNIDLKDLEDLSYSARNEYIEAQLKILKNKNTEKEALATTKEALATTMSSMDPEKVQTWVKVFGDAIKTMCTSLNVEVNNFIKTPAGLFVIGVIAYKVAGDDLLNFIEEKIFGPIGYIVTMLMLWISYTRFFGVRKLKRIKYEPSSSGGEGKIKVVEYYTEPRVRWDEDKKDAKMTAAGFHFGAMILSTLAAMIIIL